MAIDFSANGATLASMKNIILGSLIILVAGMSLQARQVIQVDGVVAMVNERPITHGEIQMVLEPLMMRWSRQLQGQQLMDRIDEAYENILRNAIDRALILEEFSTREFEIPAAAIDDHVQSMIAEEFGGSRTALLQTLAEEGLAMQEWRDQIRENIAISMMRGESLRGMIAPISPRQIRSAYEERQDEFKITAASHIWMITLRPSPELPETAVAELAEQLVADIRDGADFAELARTHSSDGFAAQGGDRGWINPERYLRAELAAASAALHPGETSAPISLPEATTWHIIHVADRRQEGRVTFDEVHDQLARELREAEEQRAYRAWMNRLRNRHHVHIFERETDSLSF